jgi:CubicO group peptidase (beta-lactamase class C family)
MYSREYNSSVFGSNTESAPRRLLGKDRPLLRLHALAMNKSAPITLLLVLSACSEPDGNDTVPGQGGQAGAGRTGAAGAGTTGVGGAGSSGCELARAALEQTMITALDQAVVDESNTGTRDVTLVLEAADGHRFVYSHGDSSIDTSYESASTSKWVAAAVILDLVDRGVLSLDDSPSKYLPFWEAEGVTLSHLLSFTSGFSKEVLCFNLPNANFAQCVETAYEANVAIAEAAGSVFDYSSTHLQIAGLMAVMASEVAGYADLFADFQARTGLFPSGAFDLPSLQNPRLAGGMHWTAAEYMQFLHAIYHEQLLSPALRAAMLENQRGEAEVAGSPTIDALNQDWAYGFGNWLECRSAIGPNTFDCGSGHRNSSPGAYGAYPFIDFEHRYFGLLARQGMLGTFRDGNDLFGVVAADATRWADACSGDE